jgi:hypothetical protein
MQHRPEHKGRPAPGQKVELRVHGVGGATPEELLDVPVTERVAGDPSAGFFRPWFVPDPPADGLVREGYSWGGLTSASRLRALWVLLSPFALANLAGWMVRHGGQATDPAERSRDALESVALALIRLFGVVLTVAFVGYITVGAVDLVAFQCGTRPTCPDGRWFLSPWENQLVDGHVGRMLVVGAVTAAVVSLAMAWLARRSQQAIHDRQRVDFTGTGDPAFRLNLHHWRLWTSPHVAHRLGLTHTAAALAAIGLTLASVADQIGLIDLDILVVSGWGILAVAGLTVLRLERVPAGVHLGLAGLASLHLLATMVLAWFGSQVEAPPGSAPGGRVVPGFLLPVYPVLALLVGAVVLALWRRQRDKTLRVALVAPAILLLSSGMVNAFGSGLLIRLADLLGTPVSESSYPIEGSIPQPPIVYADAVADAAVMTLVTLAVLLLTVSAVWLRAGAGPGCRVLAERYADRGGLDCDDSDDRDWARRVGRAEVVAALTDQAALVVGVVATIVVVITAVAVMLTDDPAGMGLGEWADFLAGPASVVLGLIPLLAVYGISRLYRSAAARRVVGILWDVATFWPRWFHPWSPPAYGERAVPQLGDRLTLLTSSGEVVVSAHSQGSVLAVATAVLADPEVVANTSFLTHGSPLTRLYARYFPEYFTPGLYTDVADRVGGWINLWRSTDYIGGPIGADGVEDRHIFDPPSTRPPALGEARPKPARHSDFDRTEEYRRALADIAGRRAV